jgi:hypothetical protein
VIGSVKFDGNFIEIFDENGVQRGTIGVSSNQTLKGYSSSILVVMDGNFVHVHNEYGHSITHFAIQSPMEFLAVVGDTIHFRDSGFTKIYGSDGNYQRTL